MSWPAAVVVAGVAAALLFGGGACYLFGTVRLQEARTGALRTEAHRQAFRSAYGWFALCAACWLALGLFWLAGR